MTDDPCPPPCVHPDNIIVAAQIRDLAGVRHRNTLIRWRQLPTDPFPEPIRTVPGPGGPLELWDKRAVAAWLERRK